MDKQTKLDRIFKAIVATIMILLALAVVAIFASLYSINNKINTQVENIRTAQVTNRIKNNTENNLILYYLKCVGTINNDQRTQEIINKCETAARDQAAK